MCGALFPEMANEVLPNTFRLLVFPLNGFLYSRPVYILALHTNFLHFIFFFFFFLAKSKIINNFRWKPFVVARWDNLAWRLWLIWVWREMQSARIVSLLVPERVAKCLLRASSFSSGTCCFAQFCKLSSSNSWNYICAVLPEAIKVTRKLSPKAWASSELCPVLRCDTGCLLLFLSSNSCRESP